MVSHTKGLPMNNQPKRDEQIIRGLTHAYWMEMETVVNYTANSINLDGVLAEEIKKSLTKDIPVELGHGRQLANRIKILGGTVPGSFEMAHEQKTLQPPKDSTDVPTVIRGVLDAEEAAIKTYNEIIELCDGYDYATQDLCIKTLAEEEEHRREFQGYLKEYEQRSSPRGSSSSGKGH